MVLSCRLKADKELVKDVYTAAKRLKMERVKQVVFSTTDMQYCMFKCSPNVKMFKLLSSLIGQICGNYLLSKIESHSAISFRNFSSCMGDGRMLSKIDIYIQEHLLEVSEQEDFFKLPRLKVSLPWAMFYCNLNGAVQLNTIFQVVIMTFLADIR